MSHWNPWRRWRERRAQREGRFATCFGPEPEGEWVSLDLETTGLDPRRDQILSMAAVRGDAARLYLRDRLDLTVRSRSPRIADAVRYHRLRPMDVRDAMPIGEALRQLLDFVGSRPLVGYSIGFDRAVIDRPLRSVYGFSLPQRLIDVRDLHREWLLRRQPDAVASANLDAIAQSVGVPLFQRHSALGDAVTTAVVYLRLKTLLGR